MKALTASLAVIFCSIIVVYLILHSGTVNASCDDNVRHIITNLIDQAGLFHKVTTSRILD